MNDRKNPRNEKTHFKSLAPSLPASNAASHHRPRRVIAVHLILTLYGHWAVNDPRGSGSDDFYDDKFEPLGPIHKGRKPNHAQPTRHELKSFHHEHEDLLNFPLFWIDDPMRREIAAAIADVIRTNGYTCYACAVCGNHAHLLNRTHKHDALTMWMHFSESIRSRLRDRFPDLLVPHHPVISNRPYKVFLYEPEQVWDRIGYVEENPLKEGLPFQAWDFVTPYDNFPFHKQAWAQADAKARAEKKKRT
jgi:REP element-mobilizing transposase RayT